MAHHKQHKKCDSDCDCTPCKKKDTMGPHKKRPLNAYMQAVMKARKSGAKSFAYNGTTYNRATTKTGMVIFKK